jgi:hypothetical protein
MAMVRKGTSPATVLANRTQQTRSVTDDYSAAASLPPWPPTQIGVHDYYRRPRLLWSSSTTGVVFYTQWKRHRINRPGVADLRAGRAATGRVEMRLHLAQTNEPINGPKLSAGGTPPGYITFSETNPRSALESTNRCENEPKTNLNEPKGTQT